MPNPTANYLNRITSTIIERAISIHRQFGPGLLESAYDACLCHGLIKAGVGIEREKMLPLVYDGLTLENAYRADVLVESCVLVEVKALETLLPIHRRQLSTYLRLGDYRVGLLLNFGARTMKEGIVRIVNKFPTS